MLWLVTDPKRISETFFVVICHSYTSAQPGSLTIPKNNILQVFSQVSDTAIFTKQPGVSWSNHWGTWLQLKHKLRGQGSAGLTTGVPVPETLAQRETLGNLAPCEHGGCNLVSA